MGAKGATRIIRIQISVICGPQAIRVIQIIESRTKITYSPFMQNNVRINYRKGVKL